MKTIMASVVAFAALLCSASVASALSVCTMMNANDALDKFAAKAKMKPAMRGLIVGHQMMILRGEDGRFVVLVLQDDGTACIVVAGDALVPVESTARFTRQEDN